MDDLQELVFYFRTKFDGIDQGSKAAVDAMQQTGQAYKQTQDKIQASSQAINKSLNDTTAQVVEMAQKMGNQYNNMSFDHLYNEFFKIEDKIKDQEQLLQDAEQKLQEYKEMWDQIQASGTNLASSPETDPQLQTLKEEADEARQSLQALQAQQEQVTQAMVNSSQAQEMKQQYAQSRMGIDTLTNSLYTLSYAAGGSMGQFIALIHQVRFLKEEFTTTAKTAGNLSAAISVGFGVAALAVTAVLMIVNAVTQAEEDAKKKAQELRDEIKTLTDNRHSAAGLIAEYEELSNKTVKTADDTQRMLDIRADLVEQYGFSAAAVDEEGRLLAGNLETMKEQLKVQQEMLLNDLKKNETNDANDLNSLLAQEKDLYDKLKDPNLGAYMETGISGMSNKVLQDFIAKWKSEISDLNNKIDAAGAIQNLLRTMVLEFDSKGKEVPEAFQTDVIDAINTAMQNALANGGTFSYSDAQGIAQKMIDAYFTIDTSTVQTDIDDIKNLKDELLSAFANSPDVDTSVATDAVNSILNSLIGDDADKSILERASQLRQKILDGFATQDDKSEYDSLGQTIQGIFAKALTIASDDINKGIPGATQAAAAVEKLGDKYKLTSKDLITMAAQQATLNKTLKDAASDLKSVASDYDSVNKEIKEVADMKAAVKAIQDYNNAIDKSKKQTNDYSKAKAFLADKYGVEQNAIDGMLPDIQNDINLKEALAFADLAAGMAAAQSAEGQILAMKAAGKIVPAEADKMIAALNNLIAKYQEAMSYSMNGTSITKSDTVPKPSGGGGGGGGGSSKTNKALQKQLDLIDQKKALDQLTTQEEINLLEQALQKYAKTTKEKQDLIEKLYALKKQKAEDDLKYEEDMDQLTLQEKIDALNAEMATMEKDTDAYRDLQVEAYQAQRELEKQQYDLKVYYGQLTLQQQEAELEKMISTYKEGTDARIELEKELYDVQQQLKQQETDDVNTLMDAVMAALKARYDGMRDTEKKNLQASIDQWKAWGDEQVAALQKQIDAIDALSEADDAAKQEAEKRAKVASLTQQLQYEQDAYNRRKLQEELASAQADLDDWLTEQQRKADKQSLENQIDAVNQKVDTQTSALQDQLDAVDAYYDQMTTDAQLQAEAAKVIMQDSQDDILSLLETYAPDYNLSGKSLGEQFVDGFLAKVGDVDTWFNNLTAKLTAYQQQLATAATAAADTFYANNGMTENSTTYNTKTISPTINITIMGSGPSGTDLTPAQTQDLVNQVVDAISNM